MCTRCYIFDSVWECDPFDLQHQLLRSFQAGAYASKELIEDFESAYCDGEILVQDSIKERLFTKSKSIFDQHSKNKRKTFATPRTDSHTNEKGNKEMEVKTLVANWSRVTSKGFWSTNYRKLFNNLQFKRQHQEMPEVEVNTSNGAKTCIHSKLYFHCRNGINLETCDSIHSW